jgi:hypothetical protein
LVDIGATQAMARPVSPAAGVSLSPRGRPVNLMGLLFESLVARELRILANS